MRFMILEKSIFLFCLTAMSGKIPFILNELSFG